MSDPIFFEQEVQQALDVLRQGGLILYPTDTVWGIGCDAMNEAAIQKIYALKQRADAKRMIILLADERSVLQYVAAPDPRVFEFIREQARPTTIIFEQAIGLPGNLVGADGTIGIRIVRDAFCRHLVKRLRRPIVSTSANISGHPAAGHFNEVADEIRTGVNHVVAWRQDDLSPAIPSQIVKWNNDGSVEMIRS